MENLKRPTQSELDAMTHAEKDALILKLFDIIERLDARITELENKAKKNSKNSSKPPSSDGLKKGSSQPREPGKNPSGGQKGHKGVTLQMTDTPDVVETLFPETKICGCGNLLSTENASLKERRQQIEIPEPQTIVTEYRQMAINCDCGLQHLGQFPASVSPNVSYGPRLKAYAVGLVNGHFIALERTSEIVKDQYGVQPSSGSIQKWSDNAAKQLEPSYQEIATHIQQAELAHFDESGLRVNGALHWLHVATTETEVHYSYHQKRGQDGINAAGILPNFKGIAVHDHWHPYFSYQDCLHALCNAHHLRDLYYFEQTTAETWPVALRELLIEAKKKVATAKENQQTALSTSDLDDLINRYDQHIEAGLKAHPKQKPDKKKRGRVKQSPETNLLLRLKDFKTEVLRFATDFKVPFTNNQAERFVRPVKVKLKMTGGFRATAGSKSFCIIRSIWETNKLNQINPFEQLRLVFMG